MAVTAQIHIVDDDEMLAEMLVDHLRDKGFQDVRLFATGELFLMELSGLNHDTPLIVILDFNLNSIYPQAANGLEILKAIQKQNKQQVSVIMYSSQVQFGEALEIINSNAKGFITKDLKGFIEIDRIIKNLLN
jgi:DNA-binding response OmpR family regulator